MHDHIYEHLYDVWLKLCSIGILNNMHPRNAGAYSFPRTARAEHVERPEVDLVAWVFWRLIQYPVWYRASFRKTGLE